MMGLPIAVEALLREKEQAGWTGSFTLNFKDGRVLAVEIAEKRRIEQPRQAR